MEDNERRITRIEERCTYIQRDVTEIKESIKALEQQVEDDRKMDGERREADRKRQLGYIMALAVPLVLALIFAIINMIIERGQPL